MREKIAFVKPLLVLSICLLGAILLTVLWFKTPVDEKFEKQEVLNLDLYTKVEGKEGKI